MVFAIFAAYIVIIPGGLISLAVGAGIKHSNALMHKICITVVVPALSLPVFVHPVYRGLQR